MKTLFIIIIIAIILLFVWGIANGCCQAAGKKQPKKE